MPPKTKRFAEKTIVPVDRSMEEIRDYIVNKIGATQYAPIYDNGIEGIIFTLYAVPHKITLPPPTSKQDRRRQWRCVFLLVKALYESIQNGIQTAERAFLLYSMLPGGQTVAEYLPREIQSALKQNRLPQLLPAHKEAP